MTNQCSRFATLQEKQVTATRCQQTSLYFSQAFLAKSLFAHLHQVPRKSVRNAGAQGRVGEIPCAAFALGILLLNWWHWRTRQETMLSPLGEVTFWVLEQPSWALVKGFQERRGRDRGGETRWCRLTLTESAPNPNSRTVQATREHSRWVSMGSDTTKHPD